MIEKEDKKLIAEGEMDYDYINNILFFKVKEREYTKSIEFENMVFDLDSENFITGIQIFDASEFLGINKENLRTIPKWNFKARINKDTIEIRIYYQISIRNKVIEKNPIIIQQNNTNFPISQTITNF